MHLSHCERLKLVRKESNGLTQQQLSHLIEIPLHKIKSIETDKTKISIEIALKIEEKLNFSFKWILTGIGEMLIKEIDTNISIMHSESPKLTRVIHEHQDLIKRFKKPERAKEINENLIEIEQLSDELLDNLASHIKSSRDAARIMKGSTQKKKGQNESFTKKQINGK